MKSLSIITALIIILFSCGPSQKEIKEREKFIQDSIADVNAEIERERVHLEMIEVGKSKTKTQLQKLIEVLENDLKTAKRKLKKIKEFQIGRSSSTRNRQVSDQQNVIFQIQYQIERIQEEISYTNLHKQFEFQTDPKETVNKIFLAARSGELEDLRHLLDPYGEFDNSARDLCLISMMPDRTISAWKETLRNGRIIGTPVVSENKAIIEVAIGSNSDRLEKIELIKRMGLWYIKDVQ